MSVTGIVNDVCYQAHITPQGHPEHHRRLEAIGEGLARRTDLAKRLRSLWLRCASAKELASIHHEAYLQRLAATAGADLTALTADTFASRGSFTTACLAVGGVMAAIDAVISGEVANAFALIRPPGHHAEISRAMGYCLLNNVALGAVHARARHGLERVLIVDWDVHHGNGTQHIFESDPGVLFFSIHQWPLFPWTGQFTEVGRGAGEGFTINLPLPRGYGDGEYAAIFRHLLVPIAEAYDPELILVSAGFDTHRDDPIGAMMMTGAGYAVLTRILMDLAERCCAGRLVMVLEGGYHLTALADSVVAVLAEMSGLTVTDPLPWTLGADARKLDYVFSHSRPVHRQRWPMPF